MLLIAFLFSTNWFCSKAEGGLEVHCEQNRDTSRLHIIYLHHTGVTCICIPVCKMAKLFEYDCMLNVCYLARRGHTMSFRSVMFLQVNENSSHKHNNLFLSTYISQWNLLLLISPFQLDSVKPVDNLGRLRSQVVCMDICEEDLNQCSVHRNKPAHYWDGIYTCQLVRIRKLLKQMHRNYQWRVKNKHGFGYTILIRICRIKAGWQVSHFLAVGIPTLLLPGTWEVLDVCVCILWDIESLIRFSAKQIISSSTSECTFFSRKVQITCW